MSNPRPYNHLDPPRAVLTGARPPAWPALQEWVCWGDRCPLRGVPQAAKDAARAWDVHYLRHHYRRPRPTRS